MNGLVNKKIKKIEQRKIEKIKLELETEERNRQREHKHELRRLKYISIIHKTIPEIPNVPQKYFYLLNLTEIAWFSGKISFNSNWKLFSKFRYLGDQVNKIFHF